MGSGIQTNTRYYGWDGDRLVHTEHRREATRTVPYQPHGVRAQLLHAAGEAEHHSTGPAGQTPCAGTGYARGG